MAYALNTHVQCSGPEGWHFVAKRAKQKTMTAVQMRNEVRLSSKTPVVPEIFVRPDCREESTSANCDPDQKQHCWPAVGGSSSQQQSGRR